MIRLPPLVLGPQIEGARVLEVKGEDHVFVARFSRQLDPEIPRVKGDEGPLKVVVGQMLLVESLKRLHGGTEVTRVPDVVPCYCCQAR